MRTSLATLQSQGYFAQLFGLTRLSLVQLASPSSHPCRAIAAQQTLRQMAWVTGLGTVLILILIFGVDAREISIMPPRGTPSLWPVRILTDFGKDIYVIGSLAVILLATAIVLPRTQTTARVALLRFGAQIEYLLLAISASVLVAEFVKWAVGRGRPFVGDAIALTFSPFHGGEAYYSFPSGHAVTAFALAFGVAAIWPRTRLVMVVYALIIAMTRLVLLAHHPSDVVGGAVVGLTIALAVRYWFAACKLGFAMGAKGEIIPR